MYEQSLHKLNKLCILKPSSISILKIFLNIIVQTLKLTKSICFKCIYRCFSGILSITWHLSVICKWILVFILCAGQRKNRKLNQSSCAMKCKRRRKISSLFLILQGRQQKSSLATVMDQGVGFNCLVWAKCSWIVQQIILSIIVLSVGTT